MQYDPALELIPHVRLSARMFTPAYRDRRFVHVERQNVQHASRLNLMRNSKSFNRPFKSSAGIIVKSI